MAENSTALGGYENEQEKNSSEFVNPNSFWGIIKSLPTRLVWLVWKVVSMQGFILFLTAMLVYFGKLDSYAWVVVAVAVLFGRASIDVIGALRK